MDSFFSPDGHLKMEQPSPLPATLDLLIVGGGPAGTAAAFRAKELGLKALVVDYDDVMKRIRDYAKDKLILPHFGGGDRMRFPAGGPLISALHFDAIDKDDMCLAWKRLYQKHNVPARIGIELTGLQQQSDGRIAVQTWNHKSRQEETLFSHHVALSIGRGVPRRFDIPGNTDGISYRLDNAETRCDGPVCIIGGGTSAAEAVIAISNAKAEAGDPSPVYWSYRGDKLPKVSRALSDVFFDAYIGNGNIRYYPNSEPVAVVTGPDKKEYLSLRIDRRMIEGRSIETTHLEFPKETCIACIGEDIPEKFLNSLGIFMATGGPKKKKRMVVSPLLETQQRNVYLIGDILSQAYLETDDHQANPDSFREIKHPGNIKSALRDGVFIAEVVKQKLAGKSQIDVSLDFVDDPVAPAEDKDSALEQKIAQSFIASRDASAASSSAPAVQQDDPVLFEPRLIRITPAGIEEDEFVIPPEQPLRLGSGDCTISFPDESSVAEHHATLTPEANNTYILKDEGSQSGTFLQLVPGQLYTLNHGDLIHIGRQFLVFTTRDAFQLIHYDHQGQLLNKQTLREGTIVIGREAPDISLDENDMILSRRHLAISLKNNTLSVKDLSSLNKSYLRIQSNYPVGHDDVFRLGQVILKLSLQENLAPANVSVLIQPPKPAPKPPVTHQPEPVAKVVAAPATGPSILFEGQPAPLPLAPNQTVLELAKKHNIPINYECESGRCGYDPVRIVSGEEHLNEMDEDEEGWTIEEVCHLEPGKHRLACMLRANGPVCVEILKK